MTGRSSVATAKGPELGNNRDGPVTIVTGPELHDDCDGLELGEGPELCDDRAGPELGDYRKGPGAWRQSQRARSSTMTATGPELSNNRDGPATITTRQSSATGPELGNNCDGPGAWRQLWRARS